MNHNLIFQNSSFMTHEKRQSSFYMKCYILTGFCLYLLTHFSLFFFAQYISPPYKNRVVFSPSVCQYRHNKASTKFRLHNIWRPRQCHLQKTALNYAVRSDSSKNCSNATLPLPLQFSKTIKSLPKLTTSIISTMTNSKHSDKKSAQSGSVF
uniref:Ovule protein n=1 Tax=Haemonchus contortus TaxID=6289 RepID=A0A7I4Z769_HAECO